MVRLGFIIAFALITVPVCVHAEKLSLETERDRVNYAIGVNIINNIKQQGIDIDLNLVIQGMQDEFAGKGLLLTDAELDTAILQYQSALRRSQGSKAKQTASLANLKTGETFLAANKAKKGVILLPSGLQYRIIHAGNGAIPKEQDTVQYHFRAMLLNKKEFKNTYKAGSPAVAKVSEAVIPALQQALKLMPAGSKWELFVPASLGYGEKGNVADVAPNSALIYEVELLGIQ